LSGGFRGLLGSFFRFFPFSFVFLEILAHEITSFFLESLAHAILEAIFFYRRGLVESLAHAMPSLKPKEVSREKERKASFSRRRFFRGSAPD
jgi:hypothetical protein